jgi:DNA-binding transcriptional ArsR family regulator
MGMVSNAPRIVPLDGGAPESGVETGECLDQVFFALADPIRRSILERLDGRALLVSELAAPYQISLQAVSRHIQVLVRAGLVQQARSGRISRCTLDVGPMFGAAVWMNRYTKHWQAQFELLAATLGTIDRKRVRERPSRRGRSERQGHDRIANKQAGDFMQLPVRGGCLCKAVRYEVRAAPQFAIHCYCRQCQHITGAGHASQFAVSAADTVVTGSLSAYEMQADSGNAVSSAFCPNCGSPILKTSAGHPALLFLHAGTLDDPMPFRAQRNVWVSCKQPWDLLATDLATA